MGSKIHHVGKVGSGMTIKLAVNSLFAIQVSALGELIAMMHQCGLDEAQSVDVLSSTPVCSPAAANAAKGIIARKFAPLFPIELVNKDLNYAIKTAHAYKTDLPLVKAAQKTYGHAINQGYSQDNITGIVKLYH